MSGYLGWLGAHWDAYQEFIPEQWLRYREQASMEGAHLRLPETVASLMTGWEMGLSYAGAAGVLTGAEQGRWMQAGWCALLEAGKQLAQSARQERPEELFLGSLRELLAQGAVYLREKGGLRVLGGGDGDPHGRAEMLGWFDDDCLYLLPGVSYTRIARHFRDQGSLFPVSQGTLRKGLKEAGWLLEKEGRTTPGVWLEGKMQRVMVLRKAALMESGEPGCGQEAYDPERREDHPGRSDA
jgi:hypothetical protein